MVHLKSPHREVICRNGHYAFISNSPKKKKPKINQWKKWTNDTMVDFRLFDRYGNIVHVIRVPEENAARAHVEYLRGAELLNLTLEIAL